MSWTVTTTTKVFPTDTPDVTPASDDRILFSDTSDGGKIKDGSISSLGFASLSWWNVFSWTQHIWEHIFTGWFWTEIKFVYSWWSQSIRIVSQDGTREIFKIIETGDVIVNWQNRTGAWTNYTPTVSWSSWSWTITSSIGKYKQLGKIVYVSVKLQITDKNTLTGDVNVSLPITPTNSIYLPINWYCVANWANPSTSSRWDAEIDSSTIKFKKSFNIAWLQRSDITNTDRIVFNGIYETN